MRYSLRNKSLVSSNYTTGADRLLRVTNPPTLIPAGRLPQNLNLEKYDTAEVVFLRVDTIQYTVSNVSIGNDRLSFSTNVRGIYSLL